LRRGAISVCRHTSACVLRTFFSSCMRAYAGLLSATTSSTAGIRHGGAPAGCCLPGGRRERASGSIIGRSYPRRSTAINGMTCGKDGAGRWTCAVSPPFSSAVSHGFNILVTAAGGAGKTVRTGSLKGDAGARRRTDGHAACSDSICGLPASLCLYVRLSRLHGVASSRTFHRTASGCGEGRELGNSHCLAAFPSGGMNAVPAT